MLWVRYVNRLTCFWGQVNYAKQPNEGIDEFNGWRGHTWLISATWCLPGQTKMPSTETMLVGRMKGFHFQL